MKRFLSMLATGALALGLSTTVSAQTRSIGAGALVLDDYHQHTVVITTPPYDPGPYTFPPATAYDAWEEAGFPPLNWYTAVPPVPNAQAGFIFPGPLNQTGDLTPPYTLTYWLGPGQTGFNNSGGYAGAWDYATSDQLGLLTANCAGIVNRIPVWTAAATLCNSSITDDGTTVSTTENFGVTGTSALSGNVGIGQAPGSDALDVTGNVAISNTLTVSGVTTTNVIKNSGAFTTSGGTVNIDAGGASAAINIGNGTGAHTIGIGNTSGGNVTIGVHAGVTNLILNGITSNTAATSILTLDPSNNVRTNTIDNFIQGANGVLVTTTGGVATAQLGASSSDVPFSSDRYINTSGSSLYITDLSQVNFASFNGSSEAIGLNNDKSNTGTTDIGNTGNGGNVTINAEEGNTPNTIALNGITNINTEADELTTIGDGSAITQLVISGYNDAASGDGYPSSEWDLDVHGDAAVTGILHIGNNLSSMWLDGTSSTNTINSDFPLGINSNSGFSPLVSINDASAVNAGTNINSTDGTGAVAIGNTATSGLTLNSLITSINTTGSGTTTIGSTTDGGNVTVASSGSNPITLDVGNTSNNLILNNIASSNVAVTSILTLDPSNNVRTNTIDQFIQGNNGVLVSYASGVATASLGGTNTDVAFGSDRYINTSGSSLYITDLSTANFASFNGSNDAIELNNNSSNNGTTDIGNTTNGGNVTVASSGSNPITLDVGNTSNNLILNNIASSNVAVTSILTLDPSNNVRTNTIDQFIQGNNGVLVSYASGVATASLGGASTDVPFTADRYVNLDGSNLNFTSNGGALTPVQIVGGSTPSVIISAPTTINNVLTLGPDDYTFTTSPDNLDIASIGNNVNFDINTDGIGTGEFNVNLDGPYPGTLVFQVTSAVVNVNTALTATGLITGDAGLTISGAAASINDNSNFATTINTGTSTGSTTIGSIANGGGVTVASSGSNPITLDVGNTSNNLILNNIASSNVAVTSILTLDPSNNVRTNTIDQFIQGNNGVLVSYASGVATASLGGTNTDVPFTSDRYVNLDGSNLNFTSNGGALTPVQIVGGSTPSVNMTGPVGIGTAPSASNIGLLITEPFGATSALEIHSTDNVGGSLPANIVDNTTGQTWGTGSGNTEGRMLRFNDQFGGVLWDLGINQQQNWYVSRGGDGINGQTITATNAGLVGIDQPTPATTLDVNGTLNVAGISTTNVIKNSGAFTTTGGTVNINTGGASTAINIGTGTGVHAIGIGNTSGGNVTIGVHAGVTNLILNGITSNATATSFLTLDGSNDVRTNTIANFLHGNDGVLVTDTGGILTASLGASNTDVPFTSDRYLNTSGSSLYITDLSTVNFASFNGSNDAIALNNNSSDNGTTDIGNTTNGGNVTISAEEGNTNKIIALNGITNINTEADELTTIGDGSAITQLVISGSNDAASGDGYPSSEWDLDVHGDAAVTGILHIGNTESSMWLDGTSSTNTINSDFPLGINSNAGLSPLVSINDASAVNAGTDINSTSGSGAVAIGNTATSGLTLNSLITSINTTGSGTTTIGSTTDGGSVTVASSGSNPITLDVGNTSNNLILNHIASNVSTTSFLTLDGSNDVRTNTIDNFIHGNDGVLVTDTSGVVTASLGASSTDVPFSSDRFVNLNGNNLNFTSGGGEATPLYIDGTNDRVGIGTNTPASTNGDNIVGLTISADDPGATAATGLASDGHQLTIQTATTPTEELELGVNSHLGVGQAYSTVQGYNQGTGPEPLVLQPAGNNVGIGAEAPASVSSLDIAAPSTIGADGDVRVYRANSGGMGGTLNLSNTAAGATGNAAALEFNTDNTTVWDPINSVTQANAEIKGLNVNGTDNTSDLVFTNFNGSGGGNWQEHFRILGYGGVTVTEAASESNAAIQISNSGSGNDITGTGGTWSASGAGNIKATTVSGAGANHYAQVYTITGDGTNQDFTIANSDVTASSVIVVSTQQAFTSGPTPDGNYYQVFVKSEGTGTFDVHLSAVPTGTEFVNVNYIVVN